MKTATALVAGISLSLFTGVVGFWLGRSSNDTTAPAASRQTDGPASRPRAARPMMSKSQTQELVALLDSQPDPLARFAIALDNMEDWVAADPAGALAWLAAQPLTARRAEVIRLAVFQWAESDPAAAAAWSKEHLQGVELQNMLIRLAEQWVATDPLSAARWFSQLPAGPARVGPLEGMFFRWAGQDPSAARAFLERELPADPNTPHILQAIHAGWAKTDPQAACASSLAASKKSNNPGLFANTLANWATMDVAASSAWLIQNVPPGPERSASIQEMAGMFAHQDPASGLTWLDQLSPEERTKAGNTLAMTWAEADAASAARWLATPHNVDLEADTTSTILIGFLAQNEDAFTTWRDALPDGPLKQQAIELSKPPKDEE